MFSMAGRTTSGSPAAAPVLHLKQEQLAEPGAPQPGLHHNRLEEELAAEGGVPALRQAQPAAGQQRALALQSTQADRFRPQSLPVEDGCGLAEGPGPHHLGALLADHPQHSTGPALLLWLPPATLAISVRK